jgi:antagonist of KipI
MSIRVIKPGLLTSVQDLGRYGYQKHGVIVSGAMDPFAHRIANLLVGNQESEATLEMTLLGPTLQFEADALIAICGADLSPSVGSIPLPLWKPILVKKGETVRFGGCRNGTRAYLAVAGGFPLPKVMGSRSTYLRAGLGGYNGRSLLTGDELPIGIPSEQGRLLIGQLQSQRGEGAFSAAEWGAAPELMPAYRAQPVIRAMRGNQFEWFSPESREAFFTRPFRVTPQSDRMGYRLEGPTLNLAEKKELISEAVAFGSVQVPAEGNPIVLLADRQTTGGYPKIAQIATVDLPVIAQTKPGDTLRFEEISREEAEYLYVERENHIRQLKLGIMLKQRIGGRSHVPSGFEL